MAGAGRDSPQMHGKVLRLLRYSLQFNEQTSGFGKNCELRQPAPHHRHLVATMEARAHVTVFVDLVGKVLTLGDRKSLRRKKLRFARKQTDAIHVVAFRLGHQSFYEFASAALALSRGRNGDRTNFGEVRAVKMKRTTTDNLARILEHYKISHVLANLRERARQQGAVTRIRRDQIMNVPSIR
jgi:hypothetical protein